MTLRLVRTHEIGAEDVPRLCAPAAGRPAAAAAVPYLLP
jgi:hypothetical protein